MGMEARSLLMKMRALLHDIRHICEEELSDPCLDPWAFLLVLSIGRHHSNGLSGLLPSPPRVFI